MKIKYLMPNHLINKTEYNTAVYLVHRLQSEGFETYLTGGAIRDCLLGIRPKDWDIATNAPPKTVASIFKKTIPTGIQFQSVTVVENGYAFEISSFRQDGPYNDGRKPQYVITGSPYEDAIRRDFTINGLFYDPLTTEIIDFINGIQDIQNKVIRCIGDPFHRFEEDRLRTIRAARICSKIRGSIETNTLHAMSSFSSKILESVSRERILSELESLSNQTKPSIGFQILQETGITNHIFTIDTQINYIDAIKRLEKNKNVPSWVYVIAILCGKDLNITPSITKKILTLLPWSKKTKTHISLFIDICHLSFETAPKPLLCRHHASYIFKYMINWAASISNKTCLKQQQQLFFIKNKTWIQKIQTKTLALNGTDLLLAGAIPGETLGLLIKIAEIISIERKIFSKKTLLSILSKEFPNLFQQCRYNKL